MTKKRDVVINIDPRDVHAHPHSQGFTLSFTSQMGDGFRTKTVNIKFDGYWWVKVLASELWRALRFERRELETNERAMKDGL